ncbi:MAG: hypothetical protein NTY09_02520 [bacterium]|nr:hypothetical protein [bacterium]
MSAKLTYAPVVEFQNGGGSLVETAENFGRELKKKEIPACIIRRGSEIDFSMAIRISQALVRHNVLPVVELLEGDNVPDFRILFETCALGTVDASWKSGEPEFDPTRLYELIYNAGRHRLPLDLRINFIDSLPELNIYQPIVKKIGELADKYGHVQVVTLTGIPQDSSGLSVKYLQALSIVCPRSSSSATPRLWIDNQKIRSSVSDFGLIPVELEGSSIENFVAKEISESTILAESIGLQIKPRLPLIPGFYAKGWYSFEIGKVLDSWTDRKVFHDYRDRAEWLED